MIKYTINEGIIQVHPQLIQDATEEILKTLFRYVYDLIPDRSVFNLLQYDGSPIPIIDSSYRILGLSHKNEYNITEMTYDEKLIPYSDKKGNGKYGLIVTEGKSKTKGAYAENVNAVIIFIDKNTLRDLNDAFFWMDDTYFDMTMEEKKDALELMDVSNDIEKTIKRFMERLPSTLEHELAHMIQYQYLKDKSKDQVKGVDDSDTDPEGYLKSNVEFSPQLISALNDYKLYIKKVDKENIKEYRLDILKYLLGMTEKSVYYYDDYGTQEVYGEQSLFRELIEGNRALFTILRRTKPTQYKKAVKYFISQL